MDGLHFAADTEADGVDQTQQAVGEGSIALDQRAKAHEIEWIVEQLLQNFEMKARVRRDTPFGQHLGMAEIISLKEAEPFLAGQLIFLLRFYFFGDQRCGISGELLQELEPLLVIELKQVDLNVVG